MKRLRLFLCVSMCCAAAGSAFAAASAAQPSRIAVNSGWAIQSSAQVHDGGAALSTVGYSAQGWYATSVPSTVVAALVENKVYSKPYFGMNLRSIPGTVYPIGGNFSNLAMPADSPFKSSWWYRTEFKLPEARSGEHIWLHFDGINYRANVWLNGQKVAGTDRMVGMWRLFEFDVTELAHPGGVNALAVEVFPPNPDDLSITWVDWNPLPADKDMGIWRDVYVTTSGAVTLRYPQVATGLEVPSLKAAHVTVSATLADLTDQPVKGTLQGQIGKITFSRHVELAAHQEERVAFRPAEFSQLNINNPRVWWPARLGAQDLYNLKLEFVEASGATSDSASIDFGIREITSELTPQGYRLFKINGKNILIRGGGWAPDMMLRSSPEREAQELKYVLGMNLNTIRMEGKLESDEFLAQTDRSGVLVMPGWCCCDHWERWRTWKPEDYTVAAESLRDQLRRLENHPSILTWLYGSDNPPPPPVEETYLKVIKETEWPNPYISSATARPTPGLGKTGVKMTGPYEYVPPVYWLTDTKAGGAYGFNTETSPGPAVPPVASLREMLPEDHLWPIDEYWNFHAGGGEFRNLKVFTDALEARYGKATGVEDYAEKSQLMTYEAERAMFEAYARNKYTSTGVIQWMLNNAWPSMIWHLYDYYLRPAGGYFGTQKACEPLHVQYSYDDRSIVVVNSLYEAFKKLKVTARIYNLDLTEKFSQQKMLDVPPDSSTRVLVLPEPAGLNSTYFVKLALEDGKGKLLSSNFYWLSVKPDVLDWKQSKWYYTPIQSYADLTALKDLPAVDLNVSGSVERAGKGNTARITVKNPGRQLAFFVHLRVLKQQGGDEILPVLWQDNYFELMPGERRVVTAKYDGGQDRSAPVVAIDGWNIPAKSVALAVH